MTSASRWLLVIAALIAALFSTSRAANYSQGDEITLTRDEPLLFREQVFRQGKAGERLTVLAHRADTKKVFVSATDKAGKQIALSVPEEAVAPVPADVERLRTTAVAAAELGKFPDALRLIDQANRSAPTDFTLPQTRNAIIELQEASAMLARTRSELQTAVTEIARIRRNAGVVDHSNPLNPNDNSNQARAEKMRSQADALGESSKQKVADAESRFQAAKGALSEQQSNPSTSAPGPIATNPSQRIPGQPGLEMTPAQIAHNKAIDEKEAAERRAEAIADDQRAAKAAELPEETARILRPIEEFVTRYGKPASTDSEGPTDVTYQFNAKAFSLRVSAKNGKAEVITYEYLPDAEPTIVELLKKNSAGKGWNANDDPLLGKAFPYRRSDGLAFARVIQEVRRETGQFDWKITNLQIVSSDMYGKLQTQRKALSGKEAAAARAKEEAAVERLKGL